MTNIQAVLLELLEEINDICQRNNINYYVIGNATFYAVRENGFSNDNDHQLEIAIKAEDVQRFYEVVIADIADNRYLECLLNSPNFPRYYLNYGNKETLNYCVNYNRQWHHHGIFLRVNILQGIDSSMSKSKKKRLSFSKKLWKFVTDPEPGRYSLPVKIVWVGLNFLRMIIGKQRVARKIFGYWNESYKSKLGEDAYFYLKKRKYLKVQFAEPYLIKFEGNEIQIPSDPEEYLRLTYGRSWMTMNAPLCHRLNKGFKDIISTEIAYRDFIPQAKQILTNEDFWKNYNYKRKLQHKNKRNDKIIKSYQQLVLRSKDRIQLYRYYQPLKKQIMALDPKQEKDYQILCELLQPYRSVAGKYYRHNLGFKFDENIESVLVAVLEQEGKSEYAARLKQRSLRLRPVSVFENLLNISGKKE